MGCGPSRSSSPATPQASPYEQEEKWRRASSGSRPGSTGVPPAAAGGRASTGSSEATPSGPSSWPAPAAKADGGPQREAERVAAVRVVAATPPKRFAPTTSLLGTSLGVPLAFVCLMEEGRVLHTLAPSPDAAAGGAWASLELGEAAGLLAVDPSQPQPLVVEEAAADERLRRLPWVAGPPHLRFLAAAPIVSEDGLLYGSLCAADLQPRACSAVQLQSLCFFAGVLARDMSREAALARREQALRARQEALRGLTRRLDGHPGATLVVDASEDGWPVLYGNQAGALASGSWPRLPPGTPFWALFDLAGGGNGSGGGGGSSGGGSRASGSSGVQGGGSGSSTPERARHLARLGAAFALTCVLRGQEEAPAAPPGQVLPLGARYAAASASPSTTQAHGGSANLGQQQQAPPAARLSLDSAAPAHLRAPPAGTAFQVTLAPCTLGASGSSTSPLTAGRLGEGGPRGADGSSLGVQHCWVATLQPVAHPGGGGTPLSGQHPAQQAAGASGSGSGSERRQPEALQGVQLGPLLGAGACGRTFMAVWQGARVAVKVREYSEAEPQALDAATASAAGGASTCSAELSGLLSDLGSDATALSAALSARAGTPHIGSSSAASSFGNAPLVEALLSRQLMHPHIVRTYTYGVSEGAPLACGGRRQREVWIVQELCSMGTLLRAIERGRFADPASGRPRAEHVLRTAEEIASALAYLHFNDIVHGDLTCANILLQPSAKDARGYEVLVCDFGLSRPLDLKSAISTGSYGTVTHQPLELIVDGRLSPKADIFAFGCVLWEMMSGRRAWQGMTTVQVLHTVMVQLRTLPLPETWPQGIRSLVRRCLQHDPDRRPTAQELLEAVQALLEAEAPDSPAGAPAPADCLSRQSAHDSAASQAAEG